MCMSLSQLLQALRVLSPKEQEIVRDLLDSLNAETKMDRFKQLRGSAKDDRFASLTIGDFEETRREVWKGLAE